MDGDALDGEVNEMEFCRRIFGAGERKSVYHLHLLWVRSFLFSVGSFKLSHVRSKTSAQLVYVNTTVICARNFVGNMNVRRRRHACNTTVVFPGMPH